MDQVEFDRALVGLLLSFHVDEHFWIDQGEGKLPAGLLPIASDAELASELAIAIGSAIGDMGRSLDRHIVSGKPEISFQGMCVNGRVLVAVDRESYVAHLLLNFDFDRGIDLDLLIAVCQSSTGTTSLGPGGLGISLDGQSMESAEEMLFHIACEKLGAAKESVRTSHLSRVIELRDHRHNQSTRAVAWKSASYWNQLYGLLTGDEGWRHVPSSRAERLIRDHWSSRHFLHVMACGSNVVVTNDKTERYKSDSQRFFTSYFSDPRPYFQTTFTIAGLEHGILFATEVASERMVSAAQLLQRMETARQGRISGHQDGGVARIRTSIVDLRKSEIRSARVSVQRYFERVLMSGVSEVSDMQGMIMREAGVFRLEDSLREKAELWDESDESGVNFTIARLALVITLANVVLTLVTSAIAWRVWKYL